MFRRARSRDALKKGLFSSHMAWAFNWRFAGPREARSHNCKLYMSYKKLHGNSDRYSNLVLLLRMRLANRTVIRVWPLCHKCLNARDIIEYFQGHF